MAGRDNNFVKVHARLRNELAVLTGGLAVHSVFIMCLELAREHSTDGTFPSAYLTPAALRARFHVEPDLTDAWLARGIQGVVDPYSDGDNVVRSLAVVEDGTVFIPGWEDDYKRPAADREDRPKGMTSTERSRRRRERIAAEKRGATLGATADATPATGATQRNGDATECNVAPLHGPLQAVACNGECNGDDRLETASQAACNGMQRMQRCNGLDKKRVEEKEQQQPRAHVRARESDPPAAAAPAAAVGYDDEEPLRPHVHTGEAFVPYEPQPEPVEMPALRSAWARMIGMPPTPDAEKALRRWVEMRPGPGIVALVEHALAQAAAQGKERNREIIPYAQRIVRDSDPSEWDPKQRAARKPSGPGHVGSVEPPRPELRVGWRDPVADRPPESAESCARAAVALAELAAELNAN